MDTLPLKIEQGKSRSDVVILGAGPVGCFTALNLAQHGVETTVFEEHSEIGIPAHCAGHLSLRSLRDLGLLPLPNEIVENTFCSADFYSPFGAVFSIDLKRPVTCAVNRSLFDKHLAKKASDAGAKFMLNTRVNSLLRRNGHVAGVKFQHFNGNGSMTARTVVDAEGISSHLIKEAGLKSLDRDKLVFAAEAEVEIGDFAGFENDRVEVYLGKEYANGFYAWIIPRLDGTAKVGVATKTGNPKDFLWRLMFKHPIASKKLSRAKVKNVSYHPISLGGPISEAHASGFLAVGDVASQVKPTTGGGVIFGLTCAKIASDVIISALQRNDASSSVLCEYDKRCNNKIGFDVSVMLRLRQFLDCLSDERIDQVLRICSSFGLGKAFQDVDEIDFQGKMLMQLMKRPAAVATLVYLLYQYLSANP